MDVLGLPVAVREVEVVDQGAIDDDAFVGARVDGVCGHEGPADLAGAVFEEGLEGGADGGLVGDVEVGEAVEGGVVRVDGLVGGCGVEGGHGNRARACRWVVFCAATILYLAVFRGIGGTG